MTNEQAVIATIQITGYPDSALEKALEDYSLTSSDNYTADNKETVNKIAVDILNGMLSYASISEGGYSVSYSVEGVRARLAQLGGGPTVKAVSIW